MQRLNITDDAGYQAARDLIVALCDVDDSSVSIHDKIERTREIVDSVRTRGDAAIAEYTERFDGAALSPDQFELTPDQIDAAVRTVPKELVAILERAHDNIRRFHEKNLRQSWEETYDDGSVLGQRITPLERVGVYVPGGKAFYPSSVLMNIVPARVAGVKEIVMVSPPSFEGSVHPAVLAAARIAGATRVFRIGGAQAVAALAYGTEHFPSVDKITGPGNTCVTAAKAIGIAEIRALRRGEITEPACREAIRLATRQYAKRQENWFRREPAFHPLPLPRDEAPEVTAARIARHFSLHEE